LKADLSISIVTFNPDPLVLGNTLVHLGKTIAYAQQMGSLGHTEISLIDNGQDAKHCQVSSQTLLEGAALQLQKTLQSLQVADNSESTNFRLITGQGNVGYGRGHNLALLASRHNFHLVLNPDVFVEEAALHLALQFMADNPAVVMLAPSVLTPNSDYGHLCKRYPSVLDLALRGFAPNHIKHRFEHRLARYEMQNLPRETSSIGIELISGSFMFCRTVPLQKIGGFSDAYFVYFEDFDLSLRAAHLGDLAFVPQVKITHLGGNASRKGWRHILLFVQAAFLFYQRNGWKWQ